MLTSIEVLITITLLEVLGLALVILLGVVALAMEGRQVQVAGPLQLEGQLPQVVL